VERLVQPRVRAPRTEWLLSKGKQTLPQASRNLKALHVLAILHCEVNALAFGATDFGMGYH